jgi:predicted small metal-binding protein
MRKVLKCRDLGVACDFSAEGETDEEVLNEMKAHAQEKHNITWSKVIEAELKKAIHSVPSEEDYMMDWSKINEGEWRQTFHSVP